MQAYMMRFGRRLSLAKSCAQNYLPRTLSLPLRASAQQQRLLVPLFHQNARQSFAFSSHFSSSTGAESRDTPKQASSWKSYGPRQNSQQSSKNELLKDLDSFLQSGKVEQALQVYSKIENPPLHSSHLLIRLLGMSGRLDDMGRIFEQFKKNHKPDIKMYNSVLTAYAKAANEAHVFRTVREMKKDGYKLDLQMYTSFLCGLAKVGKIGDVLYHFSQLQVEGIQPDLFLCNTVLSALAKAYRINNVLNLFEEMKTNLKLKPDVTTFNILLAAFGRAKDPDNLVKTLRTMEQEWGIEPDVVSYTTVIRSFGVIGDRERSVQFFHEMRKRGIKPNEVTYNAVLKCFAVLRDYVNVLRCLHQMQSYQFKPWPRVRKAVVEAFPDNPDIKALLPPALPYFKRPT